jgi:hypothetical protein
VMVAALVVTVMAPVTVVAASTLNALALLVVDRLIGPERVNAPASATPDAPATDSEPEAAAFSVKVSAKAEAEVVLRVPAQLSSDREEAASSV